MEGVSTGPGDRPHAIHSGFAFAGLDPSEDQGQLGVLPAVLSLPASPIFFLQGRFVDGGNAAGVKQGHRQK